MVMGAQLLVAQCSTLAWVLRWVVSMDPKSKGANRSLTGWLPPYDSIKID